MVSRNVRYIVEVEMPEWMAEWLSRESLRHDLPMPEVAARLLAFCYRGTRTHWVPFAAVEDAVQTPVDAIVLFDPHAPKEESVV